MGRSCILCVLTVAAGALPAQQYFPPGVLDSAPQGQGHGTRAIWYAKHLKALHEPSLWEMAQDPKAEAYRFLWLRSFHHPIAVRLVVRSSGSGWMHTRMTSGRRARTRENHPLRSVLADKNQDSILPNGDGRYSLLESAHPSSGG